MVLLPLIHPFMSFTSISSFGTVPYRCTHTHARVSTLTHSQTLTINKIQINIQFWARKSFYRERHGMHNYLLGFLVFWFHLLAFTLFGSHSLWCGRFDVSLSHPRYFFSSTDRKPRKQQIAIFLFLFAFRRRWNRFVCLQYFPFPLHRIKRIGLCACSTHYNGRRHLQCAPNWKLPKPTTQKCSETALGARLVDRCERYCAYYAKYSKDI